MAIPTAIAAFYLPVTLMCLLYFRIYLETVKRQKELHLLQAQHHTSCPHTTSSNIGSNDRLTRPFNTTGTTLATDHDETISIDSNRSHRKTMTMQNSPPNKFTMINNRQTNKYKRTFSCCCNAR